MTNLQGFVLFHRSIAHWEWYDDINVFKLFFHLVTFANFKDVNFKGVTIKRGQIARSYATLAAETGLSIQNVRTAIKKLISTQEVTQETHAKFSVFTIVNYSKYQDNNTISNTEPTQSQHATNNE